MRRDCLVIDPGLGFGKRFQHNLEILARLAEFQQPGLAALPRRVAQGLHRQDHRPAACEQSLSGSLAMVSFALAQKAAQIVRVHDVAATRDTVLIWEASCRLAATSLASAVALQTSRSSGASRAPASASRLTPCFGE